MIRKLFTALALFAFTTLTAQQFEKTAIGIKTRLNSNIVEIQFFLPQIVRVIKYPADHKFQKESLSVVKKPENIKFSVSNSKDNISIITAKIRVDIQMNNACISFSDLSGNVLLTEKEGSTIFSDFNDAGSKTYSIGQSFSLKNEEAIYGLGQLQNGKLNQRNTKFRMIQDNLDDAIPFFQSSNGYGLFWDNYSPTNFEDGETGTSFRSDVGDGIDYYFMYGKNADGVIAQMRELTGRAPMFPLWTFGYWQSRERYKSQTELVDVVKKYRESRVPLDGIILDWQYWGSNYLWNAMEFLNIEFNKPQAMVDQVHQMNAHMIISVWASFGPHTKQYQELEKINALYNLITWPQSGVDGWPPRFDYRSGVRVYDPFNPAARDIYWKYLNKGLFSMGIDGWWMDSTEPDHHEVKPEDFDNQTCLGSLRKVRNAFPLMTVGGVSDHQRQTSSDKRVFILTRSAFAGQQRYGANLWSGDVSSTWESLRNQVPAGLNVSMTGIPYWNSDIGGFFAGRFNKGGGTRNPAFQELYVRWMQFGAFTPMMRSHGTEVPREIYLFGKKGEPVYDALESAVRLRYRFLPYIYATSREVTANHASMMRALVMDFAHDKKVQDMNHEYMFGKSILVAPVLHAQYTSEEKTVADETDFRQMKSTLVYLPAGTDWYDFHTNQLHRGGQEIQKSTDIATIPLFVRAGTILPVGPDVQYATEKKQDTHQIRIYPGASGEFTLYEDENDNYNYEQGSFATITFRWNDKTNKLEIGKRTGSYKGMLLQRKFEVVVIRPGKENQSKTVDYSGKGMVVAF